MKGYNILFVLLASVAYVRAASVAGGISLDPAQFSLGGQVRFPQIPGLNAQSSSNDTSSGSSLNPLRIFGNFLRMIPGLNLLIPGGSQSLPRFPNVTELMANIPGLNSNGTVGGNGNVTIPEFRLPGTGSYIPGVSEALNEARKHLVAALNITTDLRTGLRNAIQTALNSENPAASVGIILNTIAKVYSTVAANCPLIIIGTSVMNEGIRLAGEVVRSIATVAGSAGASVGFGNIGFNAQGGATAST
ncbi:hypothetical protein TKK_0019283 [Trichogramma kaykai]|uniref:Uncharacterized protein n=1 Tax=Trichogramma kaykai TaxID=54128 RepID=A0ABD2VTF5_9HYME